MSVDCGEHLIHLKCPLPWEVEVPDFQPTQENFPGISNYFQSPVAIYHLDATQGIWRNHTLLNKRKSGPSSPSPHKTQNYNCFSKTLILEIEVTQRDFSSKEFKNMTVSSVTETASVDITACYSETCQLPWLIPSLPASNCIVIVGCGAFCLFFLF